MTTSPNLTHSRYTSWRGGHAPDDVRNAFCDAVDAYRDWQDGAPEPTVEFRGQDIPISKVCGLVWNCVDALPWMVRDTFGYFDREDMPQGSTYARGARRLKDLIA